MAAKAPTEFWNLLMVMALIGGMPNATIAGINTIPPPPDMALRMPATKEMAKKNDQFVAGKISYHGELHTENSYVEPLIHHTDAPQKPLWVCEMLT